MYRAHIKLIKPCYGVILHKTGTRRPELLWGLPSGWKLIFAAVRVNCIRLGNCKRLRWFVIYYSLILSIFDALIVCSGLQDRVTNYFSLRKWPLICCFLDLVLLLFRTESLAHKLWLTFGLWRRQAIEVFHHLISVSVLAIDRIWICSCRNRVRFIHEFRVRYIVRELLLVFNVLNRRPLCVHIVSIYHLSLKVFQIILWIFNYKATILLAIWNVASRCEVILIFSFNNIWIG